jgi:hypothetical protein
LLAAGTSNGKLSFLKITNGKVLKKLYGKERKIEKSQINHMITKVRFGQNLKHLCAVAYNDNIIEIVKLSDTFYEYNYDDENKLNKIINNYV